MKLRNYTQSTIFLCLSILCFIACKNESKQNETISAKAAVQTASLQVNEPVNVAVSRDTVIKTAVQKETLKAVVALPVASNVLPKIPMKSVKNKKKADVIDTLPPKSVSPTASIFDADKKNTDGYVPKN